MSYALDLFSAGNYVGESCCNCGVRFAMEINFQKQKVKDHSEFYCPNGHRQYYTGPNVEERLKQQLQQETERRQRAEEDAKRERARAHTHWRGKAILSGKMKHLKIRVGNGVCPCCNRSFQNLRRHMGAKHPNFKGKNE